jgi:hypothetical protein
MGSIAVRHTQQRDCRCKACPRTPPAPRSPPRASAAHLALPAPASSLGSVGRAGWEERNLQLPSVNTALEEIECDAIGLTSRRDNHEHDCSGTYPAHHDGREHNDRSNRPAHHDDRGGLHSGSRSLQPWGSQMIMVGERSTSRTPELPGYTDALSEHSCELLGKSEDHCIGIDANNSTAEADYAERAAASAPPISFAPWQWPMDELEAMPWTMHDDAGFDTYDDADDPDDFADGETDEIIEEGVSVEAGLNKRDQAQVCSGRSDPHKRRRNAFGSVHR